MRQSKTGRQIKITVEAVAVQRVEAGLQEVGEPPAKPPVQGREKDEELGIIALSEDKSIAKKSWNMGMDEVMLLEATEVRVEGNNPFKLDWYITMTNQRFILSKINHFKASAYAGLFGRAGSALTKGIPAYEIPFEHIHSIDMVDKVKVRICTKDRKVHTYEMLNKRGARKLEERINGLFFQ